MRKALLASSLFAAAALAASSALAIDLGVSADAGASAAAGGGGASASAGAEAGASFDSNASAGAAGGVSSSGNASLATAVEPSGAAELTVAAEATGMIGAEVISADAVRIGTVHAVAVSAAGEPEAIYTRVGGFLGFGATEISFPLATAVYADGTVQLAATQAQIDAFIAAGGNAQVDVADTAQPSATATADAGAELSAGIAAQ